MKNIIALLLLPFAISYLIRFFYVLSLVFSNWFIFSFFVYGFLAYSLFYFIFLYHKPGFWDTLEHELTHILFAVVMFKPVHALSVIRGGGGATWLGKEANFLIRLAPYFFPTFPMLVILLKPIIQPAYFNYYMAFLGILMSYHIFSSIKESHPWQTDIIEEGRFFSYVFIFLMHPIFLSCILLVVLDGWNGFWLYLQDGFLMTTDFFKTQFLTAQPLVRNWLMKY